MKKIILILLVALFLSCGESKPEVAEVPPFKVGDIVYLKIDTTKVIINMDLGKFDNDNFLYRVRYSKDKCGLILSSEVFKK